MRFSCVRIASISLARLPNSLLHVAEQRVQAEQLLVRDAVEALVRVDAVDPEVLGGELLDGLDQADFVLETLFDEGERRLDGHDVLHSSIGSALGRFRQGGQDAEVSARRVAGQWPCEAAVGSTGLVGRPGARDFDVAPSAPGLPAETGRVPSALAPVELPVWPASSSTSTSTPSTRCWTAPSASSAWCRRSRRTACARSRSPTTATCSARCSCTSPARARGIKPILGCEVYFTPDRKEEPQEPAPPGAARLGQEGYKNLVAHRQPRLGARHGARHARGRPGDARRAPQGRDRPDRLHGRLRRTGGPAARPRGGAPRAGHTQGLLRAGQPLRRAAGPRLPRAEAAQRHPDASWRARHGLDAGRHQRLPLRRAGATPRRSSRSPASPRAARSRR